MKIIHGYWGIRGLGQINRLLLAYSGLQWEDVKYMTPEEWFAKDKQSLGFDFPNLPYLIDNDFKLTESTAIHRYIINRCDKKGLLGKSPKDEAIVDNLLGVLNDVDQPIVELLFDKNYEAKVEGNFEKIKPKLVQLQKFIGEREFVMDYLTLVDFLISEMFNYIQKIYPEKVKEFPFLQRIHDNVNKLPEIEAYYKQQTAVKAPFLAPQVAAIQM